jgi:hypothetical protein
MAQHRETHCRLLLRRTRGSSSRGEGSGGPREGEGSSLHVWIEDKEITIVLYKN